jgi:hypothetical protein
VDVLRSLSQEPDENDMTFLLWFLIYLIIGTVVTMCFDYKAEQDWDKFKEVLNNHSPGRYSDQEIIRAIKTANIMAGVFWPIVVLSGVLTLFSNPKDRTHG